MTLPLSTHIRRLLWDHNKSWIKWVWNICLLQKKILTFQGHRLCRSNKVTSYQPMVCIHTYPEALTCVHSSPSSPSPNVSEEISNVHRGCSTLHDCKARMVEVFLWDVVASVLPLLSYETSNIIQTGSVRKNIAHRDIFLVCTIHNWQSWEL